MPSPSSRTYFFNLTSDFQLSSTLYCSFNSHVLMSTSSSEKGLSVSLGLIRAMVVFRRGVRTFGVPYSLLSRTSASTLNAGALVCARFAMKAEDDL